MERGEATFTFGYNNESICICVIRKLCVHNSPLECDVEAFPHFVLALSISYIDCSRGPYMAPYVI